MEYITVKEAADKWSVSIRWVQLLLKRGRIDGAKRFGWVYMIPSDAKKPEDGRKNNRRRPGQATASPGRTGEQNADASPSKNDSAPYAEIVSSLGNRTGIYQIALCDDEKIFAETQAAFCRKVLGEAGIECETTVFLSADDYLRAYYEDGKRYDLLLLDIYMDGMDGHELAKKIRETDTVTAIIFLTSGSDYLAKGYEVGAYRYIQKHEIEEHLGESLRKVYNEKFKALSLLIQSGSYTQRISLKDIISLEIVEKKVEITTADGVSRYPGTLAELTGKLPNTYFIRCHRAFVVNINSMYKINRSEFIAKNGKRIPISRPYLNDAKSAFLNKFQENLF
jgi:DNA-binding LytR/AlgR family response regulator